MDMGLNITNLTSYMQRAKNNAIIYTDINYIQVKFNGIWTL